MPWWAVAYVIVYAGIGVVAAWDDYLGRRPTWALAELLATALGSLFVVTIWRQDLQWVLGKAVFPLFVGVLTWEITSAVHDLRSAQPDPALSANDDRTLNWIAAALSLALVAPALAAGAVLSWRALTVSAA
jgi:hypothetical protein